MYNIRSIPVGIHETHTREIALHSTEHTFKLCFFKLNIYREKYAFNDSQRDCSSNNTIS